MKLSRYNIITKDENGDYTIYNSVSKANIVVSEEYKEEHFDKGSIDTLSREDYQFLCENNFIVEDDKDELGEIEYMFNSNYFSNDPLNIVMVPTMKCNFSCPYCFEKVHEGYNENPQYFEILKKYAKAQFHHHRMVQLSLFGGEPLLKEKEFMDFLDFVKQDSIACGYEMKTSIVTNGSLLNESNIAKLIEYGLFSLQITLDGGPESHNKTRCFTCGKPSFDLIIDKIKLVIAMTADIPDFLLNIRVNLNNNSESDLEEIFSRFTEYECSKMRMLIRVIYNTDKYTESNANNLGDLKRYYEIALSHGASLVKNTYYFQTCESCADSRFFYLMPDMSMWKCINDLNFEQAKIGKIEEDGHVNINFANITNWYAHANCFKSEECRKCSKLPDCYGGCVLHNLKKGYRSCKTFDMACLPYCISK